MSLPDNVISFIERYLPYALESSKKYGTNVFFDLAQTAIESGYGKRAIGNNVGGIKASSTDPDKKLVLTKEILPKSKKDYYKKYFSSNGRKISSIESYSATDDKWMVYDWFKDYATLSDFFDAKAKLVLKLTKLTSEQAATKGAHEMAKLVANSGYATGKNYESLLNDVINSISSYVSEKIKSLPEKKKINPPFYPDY